MEAHNAPLCMKVLFVSLEFVDPVFSGNGVLARSWVRILSDNAFCEVLVLSAQPAAEKKNRIASNETSNEFGRNVQVIAVTVPKWNKLDKSSSWEGEYQLP